MTDDGLDRGSIYRRRLARAAAASLALHMLFFGGLTVSRLDLPVQRPTEAETQEPEKRKKAADFRLHVSRSASAEKPVHERPLDLAMTADAARPTDARERTIDRRAAEQRETADEDTASVAPPRPEFERTRSDEQFTPARPSEAPERLAEITPSESATQVDTAAAVTPVEASPQASAAPAATQARDRGDAGPVAARWRPREVALLEKLTASAPDASSLMARARAESPAPAASSPLARRTATAAAVRSSSVRAEATDAPSTVTLSSPQKALPAAREPARRSSPASTSTSPASAPASEAPAATSVVSSPPSITSVARSPVVSGSPSAGSQASRSLSRTSTIQAGTTAGGATTAAPGGRAAPALASSGTGSGPVTPSAAASGGSRPGRSTSRGSGLGGSGVRGSAQADEGRASEGLQGGKSLSGGGTPGAGLSDLGETLRGDREGLAGDGRATGGGSGSPGRDTSGLASGGSGTGSLVAVDPTGSGGVGPGGGTGTPTTDRGTGGAGQGLGPATIARTGRRGEHRAAVASRGSRLGDGDVEANDEGLSVTPADLALFGAAMRERGGGTSGSQEAKPLARVTTMALPTDGRVRDVAKAFAGRRDDGTDPAGGITDRATLDRARAIVDRGLDFLVRSQLPDGRWRLSDYSGVTPGDIPKLDSDTAATGLALLCFLGAGHDHFSGPHRDTVRRGLEFLASIQQDDGDLFVPADDLSNSCSWLYSHGMASIAICEAVGMTGDPRLKPVADKACQFIATSRHPTLGGWRYIPRTDADLSVSGWMLIALRAGDLAGVKTDPAALDGVRALLAAAIAPTDPTRYAYNPRKPDQRRTDLSVACMTAVGGLMRLHTGETPETPGVTATASALSSMKPSYGSSTSKTRDAYLWYYASQVLVHSGGQEWQAWYASLVDTLEPPQRRDGRLAGSWDPLGAPPDRWGEYGGRLYVTTLHLLALEVPWRHLPTYATAPGR